MTSSTIFRALRSLPPPRFAGDVFGVTKFVVAQRAIREARWRTFVSSRAASAPPHASRRVPLAAADVPYHTRFEGVFREPLPDSSRRYAITP